MGRTSEQRPNQQSTSREEVRASEQPLDQREIQQVAMMPPHEYKGIMQAKVAAEADKITTNEIEEGGKFEVDGVMVDANGQPLDKKKDDEKKAE